MVRTRDGAGKQEPPVTAPEVNDDRCLATKKRWPVDAALVGIPLESGLYPPLGWQDCAGERDAKFGFDYAHGDVLQVIEPEAQAREGRPSHSAKPSLPRLRFGLNHQCRQWYS